MGLRTLFVTLRISTNTQPRIIMPSRKGSQRVATPELFRTTHRVARFRRRLDCPYLHAGDASEFRCGRSH